MESIEHLVHHNLPDLMLRTRIPTPRLVYLFDRAALYLHLRRASEPDDAPGDQAPEGGASLADDLKTLEDVGIRTATELALWATKSSNEQARCLLGTIERAGGAVPRLPVILDALDQETCMPLLRRWHEMSSASDTIYDPDEFYSPPRVTPAGPTHTASQGNGSGRNGASTNSRGEPGPEEPALAAWLHP